MVASLTCAVLASVLQQELSSVIALFFIDNESIYNQQTQESYPLNNIA